MTQHRTVEERLTAIEAQLSAMKPVDIVGDRFADFIVRRSPPKWLESGGPDYTGQPISTTSPEFCDALAGFLDWTAEKDEASGRTYVDGKGVTRSPVAFARKDAARARAFAAKMRADAVKGGPPRRQAGPAPRSEYDSDEIPF